jgi:osmotically-inducible protein OsmY
MPRNSDSQIKQDVLRELAWDTRVDETEVGVEVDEGIVTLTGTVSCWAKKHAAQEAAHRVLGVLDVANDLEVQPRGTEGHTDTDIAKAVRHALEWDVFVPDARIQSTVRQGFVTLEGVVDLESQRAAAEAAILNLADVTGVTNLIEVVSPAIDPEDVRAAIFSALERRAIRESDRITVVVQDGNATLHGAVHSWAEKRAVVGAARATRGVRKVEDHLRIEP